MPQSGIRSFAFYLAMLFLFLPAAHSLDAPIADPNQPQKVEVTNTPLEVTYGKNKTQIIIDFDLENGETYQSSYLNVSEYRSVAFYVTVVKEISSSSSALALPAIYQLDAFFSTSADESGYKDLDTKQTLYFQPGAQEFGSQTSIGHDSKTTTENFIKTSTGEPSSRVLWTPALGPYVRVELKSRTPGEKRKYRITAYFMI